VNVVKSPTLETISTKVKHSTWTRDYDFILVFAGLCSFIPNLNESNTMLLAYNQEGKVELATAIINDLLSTYEEKIHIAPFHPRTLSSTIKVKVTSGWKGVKSGNSSPTL